MRTGNEIVRHHIVYRGPAWLGGITELAVPQTWADLGARAMRQVPVRVLSDVLLRLGTSVFRMALPHESSNVRRQ
jgi:hypothetical protein